MVGDSLDLPYSQLQWKVKVTWCPLLKHINVILVVTITIASWMRGSVNPTENTLPAEAVRAKISPNTPTNHPTLDHHQPMWPSQPLAAFLEPT